MNSQRAFLSLPVGRTVKVSNEVVLCPESTGGSCMLKKRHLQRDEVVQNYEAWRCLAVLNVAVFVVLAILKLNHDH